MACVCSVGLDMIAIPGKTSAETISAIIADEAAIGMVNNKTTAVRIIPAIGKDVGDELEFGVDVDGVSQATKTSKGITDGVNQAIAYYEDITKGGGAS